MDKNISCSCNFTFGEITDNWELKDNSNYEYDILHCTACGKTWKTFKIERITKKEMIIWKSIVGILIIILIGRFIYFSKNPVIQEDGFPMIAGSDYLLVGPSTDKMVMKCIVETGEIPMWDPYSFCGEPANAGTGLSPFYSNILIPVFTLFFWAIRFLMLLILKKIGFKKGHWILDDWLHNWFMLGVGINGILCACGGLCQLLGITNNISALLILHWVGLGHTGMILNYILAFGIKESWERPYEIYKKEEPTSWREDCLCIAVSVVTTLVLINLFFLPIRIMMA